MGQKYANLVKNAAGRMVPTEVNGQKQVPYQGVGKYKPEGRKFGPKIASCADYPEDGNKQVATLKEALVKAGLKIQSGEKDLRSSYPYWLL